MNKEINFEVLRAISCISIVLMHSASFYTEEYYVYNFYRGLPFSFCDFLQIITRTAIPCFVMISGAFLLDKQDLDIVRFYKNSFKKLGKPTLIFSFIYIIGRYVTGTSYDALFYDTIKGQPVGQLWYMYMLFGLYGVYPFIFYYKNNLSQKNFLFFTVFMTILSCIVHYTCQLIWPIQFIEYLGYFLIGYYLRKNSTSLNVQIKKNIFIGFCFFVNYISA